MRCFTDRTVDLIMEKIILYNVELETEEFIKKCAANMRIKTVVAAPDSYMETLESIASRNGAAKESVSGAEVAAPQSGGSLMLMCGLSDKHMDRLLAKLRQSAVRLDYKAVLTPTNAKWTLKRLMLEMEREKISLGG